MIEERITIARLGVFRNALNDVEVMKMVYKMKIVARINHMVEEQEMEVQTLVETL
jgi:hypothetical protein